MNDFRSIDIDFEIHKLIESERTSFGETPNDVLRRMLKLGNKASAPTLIQNGRPWQGYGVTLPHGAKLRMSYNGTSHFGQISNGLWLVEGQQFSSPSGAASGVARTKKGGKTRLDGWQYWEVQLTGDSRWVTLWALWEAANPGKAKA